MTPKIPLRAVAGSGMINLNGNLLNTNYYMYVSYGYAVTLEWPQTYRYEECNKWLIYDL